MLLASPTADGLRSTQTIIELERPERWPTEIRNFLDEHFDLFADWTSGPKKYDAMTYDRGLYDLTALLGSHAMVGWHCTRLTEQEIIWIKTHGMQPPDPAMLIDRIDTLVTCGEISPHDADHLKAKHQAADVNRIGRIWFCFFPPRNAGEWGIGDLLGHWGGEALYNSHDRDPDLGPKLRAIGTPCLVEAEIPLHMLRTRPALTVVARYLQFRGLRITDRLDFEDRITNALSAPLVRRVIAHPDPDFVSLTGCALWSGRVHEWGPASGVPAGIVPS